MPPRLIIALLLVCLVVACRWRSGDFTTIVVSEVVRHGGHTVTNGPLPALPARFTIKSDANGFQASVKGATFASIDAVMQQAFGPPKMSLASNLEGQPHRVWAAGDIGVAIQLVWRADGADIICVRAMRDMGEMFQNMGK